MKKCLNCGYERQPKDEGIIQPTECPRCHIIYDKIKDGEEVLKDAAGQKHMGYMKRSKNMPALVYWGLLGFNSRGGAKGFLWLSLILGICCFFFGSAICGILFLLSAAWYSYAIKWADNNSAWSNQVDSHTKPDKRKRKWGYLIFFVFMCVCALILYVPYIGKEKAADTVIESMTPQLKAGMNRNSVTGILEINGFKINTTSPPKKNPENRQIFVKGAGTSMYSWVRYDVFIEYNENGLLKFARFLKSRHSDGQDTSCLIIFEIPSNKNKPYPFPCPADVQEF